MSIDLTPFGFTPGENAAYVALLDGGPASGYGVAKRLGVARANAYQALNGLVRKKAATVSAERPHRYRAVRPDAVLALVVDASSQKIDALAEQVGTSPSHPEATVVMIEGRRSLADLAMRTAARERGEVLCIGPTSLLLAIAPAWRKRETDGKSTVLWATDEGASAHIAVRGVVPSALLAERLRSSVFLLIAGDIAIAARITADSEKGFWATDPTLVGVARAAALGLIEDRTRAD